MLYVAMKIFGMGKNRPPPYYITLDLEGYIIHNCMIGSRVVVTVMPKRVSNMIDLTYTQESNEVL